MNRLLAVVAISAAALCAQGQRQTPTPGQSIHTHFTGLNQRILEMAKDFPEAKYDYKPTREVRSFGDVIVHIASINVWVAKAGRGENVKGGDIDPATFKGKAAIVAALQKSIDDAMATLKATPDDRFKETLSPWMGIIEDAAEHYGQLVVYYRANGLVPPASRPKGK